MQAKCCCRQKKKKKTKPETFFCNQRLAKRKKKPKPAYMQFPQLYCQEELSIQWNSGRFSIIGWGDLLWKWKSAEMMGRFVFSYFRKWFTRAEFWQLIKEIWINARQPRSLDEMLNTGKSCLFLLLTGFWLWKRSWCYRDDKGEAVAHPGFELSVALRQKCALSRALSPLWDWQMCYFSCDGCHP